MPLCSVKQKNTIMSHRILRRAALLAPLLLGACVETHAYLGAGYESNLALPPQPLSQPLPVRVETEFRTNEEPSPGATKVLAREVKRVLEDSGVYRPAADADLVLRLSVDDRADLHQARHNGFMTGFTVGRSGEATEDRYDFALALEGPRGVVRSARYQAVLTTTGLSQVPASYGQPHAAEDAFNIIVRDTVNRFLAVAAAP
jgi:hypothetical protein